MDLTGFGYTLGQAVGYRPSQIAGVRTATVTNQGVSGSRSSDWISGSTNLVTAKAAFASAAVTHVLVRLGTNDSRTQSDGQPVNRTVGTATDGTTAGGNELYQEHVVTGQRPRGERVQGGPERANLMRPKHR